MVTIISGERGGCWILPGTRYELDSSCHSATINLNSREPLIRFVDSSKIGTNEDRPAGVLELVLAPLPQRKLIGRGGKTKRAPDVAIRCSWFVSLPDYFAKTFELLQYGVAGQAESASRDSRRSRNGRNVADHGILSGAECAYARLVPVLWYGSDE